MKKNKWNSIRIKGPELDRSILCSYLENYVLGIEYNHNSARVFFDNVEIDNIQTIINENNMINNCNWDAIEEENWMKNCKDFFKSVLINNTINIIPPWEKEREKYINIKINPALAFGTGHHETTYMMIEEMLKFNMKNKTVFDIGAGSGILSILADKLKASSIYSIDNDKLIYNNFIENINLNNITENLSIDIKDCLNCTKYNYDIILANINKEVLLSLIDKIKRNGKLIILSGILHEDEKQIIERLNVYGKNILSINRKKEWSCIVAK